MHAEARSRIEDKAVAAGSNLRTLQPKLRMIANGDATVNTVRAGLSAALKVTNEKIDGELGRALRVLEFVSRCPTCYRPGTLAALRSLRPNVAAAKRQHLERSSPQSAARAH
jgi:hypothetical protein